MTDDSRDEVQFIPWSELLEQHRAARPWAIYLAAGVLATAALGAVVARALWRPAPEPVVALEAPAPEEPVGETETATPLPLYREADLRAAGGRDEPRLAALRAEWFVTDFFTVDGEPGEGEELAAALPSGVSLPALLEEAGGPVSYVEWARAAALEQLEEGLYRVTVAYRSLVQTEGGFRRQPVRAVAVVVGVGPGGGTAVLDLPAPAALPPSPDPVPWPGEGEPAPPAVLEAALAEAATWGDSPEVLESMRADTGWRVVVAVGDGAGRRWPLSLWLDEAGLLASPPWLGHGPP